MVPRMQERAGSILDAQQARGLPSAARSATGSGRSCRSIGPVLLGSLIDVRERTFALEARGFGARPGRTAYRVVADPPATAGSGWRSCSGSSASSSLALTRGRPVTGRARRGRAAAARSRPLPHRLDELSSVASTSATPVGASRPSTAST